MFLLFPFLSFSYTWEQLATMTDIDSDEILNVLPAPSLKPHASKRPLIFQSEAINRRITDDCPFIGIAKCTFDSIDLKSGEGKQIGLVELCNTKLQIQDSKFTNIKNGAAISLTSCYMSIIKGTTFENFEEASSVVITQCNDITINSTKIKNCIGTKIPTSAVKIVGSTFVLIDDLEVALLDLLASPIVVNLCDNITINRLFTHNNRAIAPGQIYCTASVITIQNSKFSDNNCGTHSCALLSKDCFLTLAHSLFTNNLLFTVEKFPDFVSNFYRSNVATCVTIYESLVVGSTDGSATILKNIYFDGNSPLCDIPGGNIFVQSIDLYYDGPNPKIIGTLESTGDDFFQIYYSNLGDLESAKTGVAQLSWNETDYEPLIYSVSYINQPMLPMLSNVTVKSFFAGDSPMQTYNSKYSFITIKKCEFNNAIIHPDKFDDSGSLIHINLNNGGYVSIEDSIFSKANTVSSVVEIINAKGVAINDCTFTRNYARFSSGLLVADVETLRICHTKFEKNTACNNGALSLYRVKDALIVNSKFRKNAGSTGPSALVLEDTNLMINDTIFVRNKNDVETSSRDQERAYLLNETLSPHTKIAGVKQHFNMSATLGAYGTSVLTLDGAVFNDNEDESGLGSEFINLTGLDGHADPTVKINVISSCTDTKHFNFNYNWSTSLRYDPRKCDLKKIYGHREYFQPKKAEYKYYAMEETDGEYNLIETVQSGAFVHDPVNRVPFELKYDIVIPPPSRTPYPAPPAIKEGLAPYKTVLISIGTVCLVVLVVGVTLIYIYRKKPENRLNKETEEQKAVMDGLMSRSKIDSPYADAEADEVPQIETQNI